MTLHGAPYMIGVDIGGTFTDCVVMDAQGHIVTGKSPTTPDDRSRGFFNSIERAADELDVDPRSLLENCSRLVHGTTTGTNAIVERRGAQVGLLATRGHDGAIFVMKGTGRTAGLSSEQALDVPETYKPAPLIPQELIRPITERVDVDGDVIVPLAEDEVRGAVEELVAAGAEALTISFLWSTINTAHEERAREIALEVAPDLFISCSSDLSAKVGEYERTITAVMNSYIGPLMVEYVDRIQDGAAQRGFAGTVQFAQCAGGAITSGEARRAPIRTVQSGPVAGTIATQAMAGVAGLGDVMAVDMGGTTFDVSVIHDGRALQRDISLFERYAMALPMLDIESVGAGGGSIAWVDDQGRLNVGPQSAGARPGPACYGFGGTEPTVTDADVVLGLIDPDKYLGGRMKLDADLAREAVGRLADRLGLGVTETAAGISTVVDAKMADLVRRMSLLRGLDPRRFACAAFGGGGPLHSPAVAAQAGIRTLIVPLPRAASVWSAFGAATSDVAHVFQRWTVLHLPAAGADVEAIFGELEGLARTTLHAQGVALDNVSLVRSVRMRYSMQIHDVEVPVPAGTIDDAAVEALDGAFERIHDELFGKGSGFRAGGVDFTAFQVRATAHTTKPSLAGATFDQPSESSRPIYWPELRETVETTTFDAVPGEAVLGPALIELADTVIVIRPGQSGRPDAHGNYIVTLHEEAGPGASLAGAVSNGAASSSA
jgi:N-methylhydantoinase A